MSRSHPRSPMSGRQALFASALLCLWSTTQAIAADPLTPASSHAGLLDSLDAELQTPPRVQWPGPSPHPLLITEMTPRQGEGQPTAALAALSFLRRHPELLAGLDLEDLQISGEHALGGGRGVSLAQTYHGVPVEGRGAWLWVDDAGAVRALRLTLAPRPTQATPTLSRAQAEALAARQLLGSPALQQGLSTRLVYLAAQTPWASGGPPRLAWELHPWPHEAVPSDRYLYMDAQTGEVLLDEDRLVHLSGGRAFDTNPVVDGWLAEDVTLDASLDLSRGALESAEISAVACLDQHQRVEIDSDYGPEQVHVCTIGSAARADAGGDFYYEPDYLNPGDPFAEVQGFHHAHRFLDFMAGLGVSAADIGPIQVVVNYMAPDGDDVDNMRDPFGRLIPVTNAFFTGGSVPGETASHPPRLQFGQGEDADIVYDADVLYHEFGHAVVATLDGPRRTALGRYGLSNEAPALNEAFADYLSSIFTEDPIFAEYASWHPGDPEDKDTGWRDLENTKTCVDDVQGAPHNDGQPWSAALWTSRSRLPEGQHATFDRAVVDALRGMGAYAGFAVAADLVEAMVRDRLGAAAGEVVAAEFEARHFAGCARWRLASDGLRSLGASGTGGMQISGPAPGPLQLVVPVSRGGVDLVVRGYQRESTGSRIHLGGYTTDPNPYLRVLARLDTPVEYVTGPGLNLGLYDFDVPVLPTGEISQGTYNDFHYFEARVPVEHAGDHYLMLGSTSTAGGNLSGLTFTEQPRQAVTEDPRAPPPPTLDGTHARCGTGPAQGPGGALLLLIGVALGRRGRRARRGGLDQRGSLPI